MCQVDHSRSCHGIPPDGRSQVLVRLVWQRFAAPVREGGFATNSPQAEKVRAGLWRISAGFNGLEICGKRGIFKKKGLAMTS